VLFLGSGVGGSIASAALSQNISVGASGGIFGLLGASLVFAFRFRGVLPKRVVTIMGTALVPWVIFNLVAGYFLPIVDVHAHWGGLVAGSLLACAVPPVAIEEALGRVPPNAPRLLASACLSLLLVSFASAGRNIFLLRGESGAILDPRVATGLFDLDAAIEKEPNDPRLLSLRAQREVTSGQWIEAIHDYQKILALEPDDSEALNNLAWLLLEEAPEELRNRTEAARLAERAFALDPKNAYVLGTYGTVLLRGGDPGQAVTYLEQALAQDRPRIDEATDRYLLAIALARAGRFDDAAGALEAAIELDPMNRYRFEAEAELEPHQRKPGDPL
jgi:rhomboid protease GluP